MPKSNTPFQIKSTRNSSVVHTTRINPEKVNTGAPNALQRLGTDTHALMYDIYGLSTK
ncbi:MAG: hypothetical protein IPN72_17385 [Saprospiraceae bacterium]|nr:hypothetical protein [Saprospiraceae bacterium]